MYPSNKKTSLFYRDSIELPFFVHHLKGKGELNLPEATVFMTGKNEWQSFDQWPPKTQSAQKLYFREHGKLSFQPANSDEKAYDEYVSDPAKPVPYTEEITFGMTREYMTDDQRFAAKRPDVLVFETEVLTEDLILAGPLTAHLKVSTSETAADWIVKLIDVYPKRCPGQRMDSRRTKDGQLPSNGSK